MIRFMGVASVALIAGCAAVLAQGSASSTPAKPWLIAHRGASAYAPENTVPAFRLAADQHATDVDLAGGPALGRREVRRRLGGAGAGVQNGQGHRHRYCSNSPEAGLTMST